MARQSFQLFRQMTWFPGNNRDLFKFKYRNLHYLIIIKSVRKSQFFINHTSHFNDIKYFDWAHKSLSDKYHRVKESFEVMIFSDSTVRFGFFIN